MNWAKVRGGGYAAGFVAIGAALLQGFGLAEVDWVAGTVDIKPFGFEKVGLILVGLGANLMAFVSILRGWQAPAKQPRKPAKPRG
jgi:hypothetical protein